MKAPVLHGRRTIRFEDVPDPAPGENDVIVEVGFCGICGSDLHLYDSDMAPDGIVLGHEFGGTIVEHGRGVTGWKAGQRVVGAPMRPCMNCPFCLKGEYDMCYSTTVSMRSAPVHRRPAAPRSARAGSAALLASPRSG